MFTVVICYASTRSFGNEPVIVYLLDAEHVVWNHSPFFFFAYSYLPSIVREALESFWDAKRATKK